MSVMKSEDGRYSIHYNEDFSGYAQIVEYAGFAPAVEVRRSEVPFELLATLMDKMLFNVTDTGAIMTVETSPVANLVTL